MFILFTPLEYVELSSCFKRDILYIQRDCLLQYDQQKKRQGAAVENKISETCSAT
jgi:hypothetical protein